MNETLVWFASAAFPLLDTGVKATVLLVVALLATALLRRASAAVRHRVWCLAFAGLLLLPAALATVLLLPFGFVIVLFLAITLVFTQVF